MQTGTYNYFLNDQPAGIVETFEIEILPDRSKWTSTRDAKPYETMITVEATEKANKFQSCQIIYQKEETEIEALYEFSAQNFRVLRKVNSKIVQDETFVLPENAVFFPLMRCFQGQTILQVSKNQEFTTVIVPDIQFSTDTQDLLKPTFDERTASLISTNGNLRIFRYLSKHYDENSEFHLDENDLLVYYKFVQDQFIWTVQLQS